MVDIRGQEYRIPIEYMLPDLSPAIVSGRGGMDEDDAVNLAILLTELGITPIPHKVANGNANKVHVLLYGTTAPTIMNEYGLNPDAYDAWTRQGGYRQNRIIEKDEKTGLYRIYRRQGTYSWHYFKEPPSETGDITIPKWVAGCAVYSNSESDDMSNVTCHVQLISKWGNADISFTGRYLSHLDQITESIQAMFKHWIVVNE
jgi:hypothetical protein